jgi:hypothetical protein
MKKAVSAPLRLFVGQVCGPGHGGLEVRENEISKETDIRGVGRSACPAAIGKVKQPRRA